MKPRSATLIERRAELEALKARIKAHQHVDTPMPRCQCDEMREMRQELAAIRKDLATWFDPPPDMETLF